MIRPAELSDRPHFLRLWSRMMTEQEKEGSHLKANLANLYRCLDLFEGYITGSLFGFCILYQPEDREPVGAVMAGELAVPDEFETDLGRLATLWGVYVDTPYRGQGIGVKLLARAYELGSEIGFDAVETYVRAGNTHGERMAEACDPTVYMRQHVSLLRDPKMFDNEEAQKALAREVSDD